MSVNVQQCFEEWMGQKHPSIDLAHGESGHSYLNGEAELMWRAFYGGYTTHEHLLALNFTAIAKSIGWMR